MKKYVLIITLFCIIFTIYGCKKKTDLGNIDYHIVGVYIEIEEDEKYDISIGTINPCVYYKHKSDVLRTDAGTYPVQFSDISKNHIDDDEFDTYIVYATALFHESTPNKVKVYHILEDLDGNCYVDTTKYEQIDLSRECNYNLNYTYQINKTKYHFELKLKYLKRGA